MKNKLTYLTLGLIILLVPTACEEDETSIGTNLQDPNTTLYNGLCDTITGSDIVAYTVYDSNMRTSGYTTAMIGHYNDPTYGLVDATLYTQVGLTGNSGIRLDSVTIDSVILSLVVDDIFPTRSQANLHVKVSQLATRLYADSTYTADETVGSGATFFDGDCQYSSDSKTLRMHLGGSINNLFKTTYSSQEDFQERFKGLCIQTVKSQSDAVLCSFSFTASNNKVSVYYTDPEGDTTHFDLTLGCNSATSELTHFCHFAHNYTVRFANLVNGTVDSIDGAQKLYLEPLGGMGCWLNMNAYVERFHAAHPYATIHYAELLLPVNEEADSIHPLVINVYKRYADGTSMLITDGNSLLNSYTYNGYDGTYNNSQDYYRIRCTQHLQEVLRVGHDYGMMLLLNERRSKAARTILNGPQQGSKSLKVCFVYTEGRGK